jgi:hypothetical protein
MLDEGTVAVVLDTVDVLCQIVTHASYDGDQETRRRLFTSTSKALVEAMRSPQWRIIGSRSTLADQWAMLVLRHAQGLDARERILLWHEMGNVQNGGPLNRLLWRTDEGRRERLEALALGG